MTSELAVIPAERVERLIYVMRGQKVMLDADLAAVYGVATRALNRAVNRNPKRFPADFMFRLSQEEFKALMYQIGTSNKRGGRRKLPYAFTEHGAVMAASVLNSPRAVQASIFVVRAFVKLRELVSTHKELAHKLAKLEAHVASHDGAIKNLFAAIRELMMPPPEKRRGRMGFRRTKGRRGRTP